MRGALPMAVSLAFGGVAAGAAELAPESLAPAIVELRVNGQEQGPTLVVRRDVDGTLLVRTDDLPELRLNTPAHAIVVVDGEPHLRLGPGMGARVEFDDATQTASVSLPAAAFVATRSSASSPDLPQVTDANLGAFVNYDLYGEEVERETRLGAIVELGVFGRRGVVTNSLLGRDDETLGGAVRLESTWTLDLPERLATLRVGDAISTAGAWGRAARFGGLQFGTNFSTQPTLVTTPLLHAQGEAILPSTVDVFVNGRRVASETVPPGPFAIDRLPPITGAGQLQVVVTDALGRQQVVSQPYYTGPSLLRAGLDEYSFELGAIREDYGFESNDYGDFVASATFRRGYTDRLTAEVHAEGQAGGAAALGLNAAWQAGNLGILNFTAAAGGESTWGVLGGLGFERNGRRLSVFLRTLFASEHFAQLGTSALENRPRQFSFGGAGVDLGDYGNLQLSYGRQENWASPTTATLALSHSVELGAFGHLNLVASRSSGGNESTTELFLNWTMGFGDRRTASVSLQHAPGRVGDDFEAVATLQQSLPPGSGTGYYAEISSSDDARLDYAVQGSAGLVGVQYARRDGRDGWRLGANGAVALTGAGILPSRRLERSFAVVQVADYPGITVYVDNQPVGVTDESGRVLLDRLRPYERNAVSIDPRELPLDASLANPAMNVTPAYRSGPRVVFPVVRASAATLRLVTPDGTPVPAGASVITAQERVPVAMEGLVYLTAAGGLTHAEAEWGGRRCRFPLDRPDGGDPQPDLGTLTCEPVAPGKVPDVARP